MKTDKLKFLQQGTYRLITNYDTEYRFMRITGDKSFLGYVVNCGNEKISLWNRGTHYELFYMVGLCSLKSNRDPMEEMQVIKIKKVI